MEYESLVNFYNELSAFAEKGDEQGAQKFLEKNFPVLPEELQGELLTRLYFNTLQEETERLQMLADIQQKTLDVIDALEAQKREADARGGA